MPQPEPNTTGLADAAERRHDHAVARARAAIHALDSHGETISFQSVRAGRASHASSSTRSTSFVARLSGCDPPACPPVRSRCRPRSGHASCH
jgi:hypothetical protein